MIYGRIVFNCNSLNGHYFYPPFFSNTRDKEEKTPLLRGHNSWKYQSANGNYFWHLSRLEGLPFQKIIVAKIPQGEEGGSNNLHSKNAVYLAAILDFKMAAKPGT